MAEKELKTPLTQQAAVSLTAGDTVLISGTIYTARDAAHKKLLELLDAGKPLPVALENQIIYYVGPTPAKPGEIIGSAGPTTSSRMDAYTPKLLAKTGLRGMIGKGYRSADVTKALVQHQAVYFTAVGGAGALLASCIKSCAVAAYPELGAEAIYKLEVERFPAVVTIDCRGADLYKAGREQYLNSL